MTSDPKTTADLAMAIHHRDLLAKSLGDLLVAMGVVRSDANMSVPDLLCAADAAILHFQTSGISNG